MKSIFFFTRFFCVIFALLCFFSLYAHAQLPQNAYNMGSPALTEIWVDPVSGNDANSGSSQQQALKTLTAAWNLTENFTASGYRLNLLPGTFTCEPNETDNCLNYFGNRQATYEHPLIIQAVNGKNTVTIRGGLDLFNLRYVYLIDLNLVGGATLPTNISGNNLLHLSSVDHLLLRGLTVQGPSCDNDGCNNLQEVLKVNQAQYLYVEDSKFSGAWHTVVDYFAVQHGHFLSNEMHTAGQWCMYYKGGTSYLRVEGNELHDCYLGFQSGQSSNFPVMVSPWLHYETYDIKFVNNILHDIPGVPLSVAGGYNILFAYNTLYNVGTNTGGGFPLFQAVFGERGCNRTDELQNPLPVCQSSISSGGWGPNIETANLESIPNKNVFVYNNVFYNPSGSQTHDVHLTVWQSRSRPQNFINIPDPMLADNNLQIRGNIIWNGPASHPLGIESDSGCANTNPTCNQSQLLADNTINQIEPQLVNPAGKDYHPVTGGNLFGATTYSIPAFTWVDAPASPATPTGTISNIVTIDYSGATRGASTPPGAYSGSSTNPTNTINSACSTPAGGIYFIRGVNITGSAPRDVFCANFNNDSVTDIVAANHDGTVKYTLDSGSNWIGLSGSFSVIGVADINGDGKSDVYGVNSAGNILVTYNLSNWTTLPGSLLNIVNGNFNTSKLGDEFAGLNDNNYVYYTNDLSSWTNIPGVLSRVITGDVNGDGNMDVLGLNSNNEIFYSTNLATWTNIPGNIVYIITADVNGDGKKDIIGYNNQNNLYYTTNLASWTQIPGALTNLVAGDINSDGKADIAGKGLDDNIYYTTDLNSWTRVQ